MTIETRIAKNGSKRYYVREENGKLRQISYERAREIERAIARANESFARWANEALIDTIDEYIVDIDAAAEVETATTEQISTDAENATADIVETNADKNRFMVDIYFSYTDAKECTRNGLESKNFANSQAAAEWIISFANQHPNYTLKNSTGNYTTIIDFNTRKKYVLTDADIAALNTATADNTATDAEATSLEEMTNEYNAAFIAFGKAKDEFYRLSISYGKTGQLDTYKDLSDAQIKLRNARARLDNINKAFDDIQIRAINKQADYLKDKITRDAQSSGDNVFELLPKVDELNDIDELTDYERDILFAKSLGELIGQRFAEKAIAELDKKKKTAIIICREFTQLDRSTQLDDRR